MTSKPAQDLATPTPNPSPQGGRGLRRGACPGLSAPILTGDGLLARLLPTGTIALDAFGGLCAAARQHGNGIIEITARGSIQVRGLSAASAIRFAETIAGLNIAAADGIPVLSNPLAGLDADEILDASETAAVLRRALAKTPLPRHLAPKVSVMVDGGSALNLHRLAADVRLCAERGDDEPVFRIGVAGDQTNAMPLGTVAPDRAIEVTLRLLDVICRGGHAARARDIVAADAGAEFRATIADFLTPDPPASDSVRTSSDPISEHRLRDGTFARGFGFAFGHADAATLTELVQAAADAGAAGLRLAPGRALMIVGLTQEAASALAATAETLGYVVRPDDPRRFVFACAGAPICSSAHIPARALAPRVAEIAAPQLGATFEIHISGCPKGCAHAKPVALTIVGTDQGRALVANGNARGERFALVAPDELAEAIEKYAARPNLDDDHV
jgi:precorrin-3B synthase